MIIGHLGLTAVTLTLDAFSNDDMELFTKHWQKWSIMVNKDPIDKNEAYHHLLDMITNNSLALNETSTSISLKWTNLFKESSDWKFFFDSAPFELSVTKVSFLCIFTDI